MSNELERELGRAVDRSLFQSDDPETIRREFTASFEDWAKERSTLGGYLRDIRFLRELDTATCARKVGVSQKLWQSWEADRETPSAEEIEKICQGMGFGEEKHSKLLELRSLAPRHRLLTICRLRPELLAARGVAKIEASLEWRKLPKEVQRALIVWGERNDLTSFEEIMEFFFGLDDEKAREAWVDGVLNHLD